MRIRGVTADEALEFLSNTPELSGDQIETALDLAVVLSASLEPVQFGTTAALLAVPGGQLATAVTVGGRTRAVLGLGNALANRVGLETTIREHLDTDFARFRRNIIMDFLRGPGLNSGGSLAIEAGRIFFAQTGDTDSRIQDLIR